jgi:hypothetical protein
MSAMGNTTYLPSWKNATDPSDMTMFAADGTLHFSDLKRIADSGVQYLHGLVKPFKPTPAMLIGTGVHHIVLGKRPTSLVARFPGEKRIGNDWKAFAAAHPGHDILTTPEWDEAEQIATAVLTDPVAREYLDGAEYEVPLTWMDGDIKCSTTGVDIVQRPKRRIGDLKTTNTTEIEKWQRQAFSFSYHCQMSWYRRGCIANGIDVSDGMFLLGVDVKPPHEVVVLEMSEELCDLAERTLSLWMERFKTYADSRQFPGRAQSAVVWTVPAWMQSDEDEL